MAPLVTGVCLVHVPFTSETHVFYIYLTPTLTLTLALTPTTTLVLSQPLSLTPQPLTMYVMPYKPCHCRNMCLGRRQQVGKRFEPCMMRDSTFMYLLSVGIPVGVWVNLPLK